MNEEEELQTPSYIGEADVDIRTNNAAPALVISSNIAQATLSIQFNVRVVVVE